MSERARELNDLTIAFLDAFNRNDLDAVMGFFTDDAVYEELHGPINMVAMRSGRPSHHSSPASSGRCNSSRTTPSSTPLAARS